MLGGFSLVPDESMPSASVSDGAEDVAFDEIKTALEAHSGESSVADDLLSHIDTQVTDEGLVVTLYDIPDSPLFFGTRPTPLMKELIAVVDDFFRQTPNDIAVYGYVSSDAVVLKDRTAWPLSTGRAESIRALLANGFTTETRIARMAAYADNQPIHPDPLDTRNNRIELVLLREN